MRQVFLALLVVVLGGSTLGNSKRVELVPLVEVSVAFRHLLVPSESVYERACRKRRVFYVAPGVTRITAEITAYNPVKGQTDTDPHIAANNRPVFDGGIASNIFPCGARLQIPELFGDKVFVVNDRMNKRYQPQYQQGKLHLDTFLPDIDDALAFGRRDGITVVVLSYPDTRDSVS